MQRVGACAVGGGKQAGVASGLASGVRLPESSLRPAGVQQAATVSGSRSRPTRSSLQATVHPAQWPGQEQPARLNVSQSVA